MDFQAAGMEYGSPFNDFHRADLHRVLLDRAVELGAVIQTRAEVTDIRFDDGPSRAVVSIRDQPDQVADLVIGADGINSRCREILLGKTEPPHRTGDMAYRILLDAEEIRKDPDLRTYVDDKAVNYWYGPGAHVGKTFAPPVINWHAELTEGSCSDVSPPQCLVVEHGAACPG